MNSPPVKKRFQYLLSTYPVKMRILSVLSFRK
jgi:hypothetical protein